MQHPPIKLFDTHAHFFTNDTRAYPIDVSGAREGEEAARRRLAENPATAEKILALWDKCNVAGGTAVQYNTMYKTDNSYAIDVAAAHPDRVAAVLILKAAEPETPTLLRSLAKGGNVAGLRLFGYPDANGEYPWLDSPAALKTWEEAAALGLTMVVMYAPGRPSPAAIGRIATLARRFAPMTVAIDHCGWPALDKGDEGALGAEHLVLADVPNVSFKFTHINVSRFAEAGIDSARYLRRLVDTFGAGRVMWGSDFGNTKAAYETMAEQAVAATALLDERERAAVLHDSGWRLFMRRRQPA
ncbi:MAG TPA: amidohydrolase family protein [Sphingomonadaceae bacterium]|nr:amidohydrolase family protein [Sphingomonadaceae bacterium]